jgi:cytosine/creatinine deaminase
MDRFMQAAIEETKNGSADCGISTGSVLFRGETIIGRGHNPRVPVSDPVLHAEIDCLRNAGRIRTCRDSVLYSTIMPCYLCSGAVLQFGIPKAVAGEAHNFPGTRHFLEEHGVEVIDLNLTRWISMMQECIATNPRLWREAGGEL